MIAAFLESIPALIVATGALVGIAASLLGTFLVLRGSAMLTDAISHAIVLGIVLVWLATGATHGPVQVVGAALAGVACVAASEALARSRLVAMDAAIGLVFPALFALGILLVNLFARDVHIDADTVLLGEIGFVWLDTVEVAGFEVPGAMLTLAVMLGINGAFVTLFWKELKLATFDPELAAALGFAPALLHQGLLVLTSATAVAAFDAVGAILFIAFVVAPPATALLLTDRLGGALALACSIAVAASASGYAIAVAWDVSIGGMMATMTGVFFGAALLFAPRHGLIAQGVERRGRRLDRDCHTLVAHLHTHQDGAEAASETRAEALVEHLRWDEAHARRVVLRSLDRALIRRDGERLRLTEKGEATARAIFEPWARGRRS